MLVTETSAPIWGYNAELERAMIIGPPTDEMRRLFDHAVAAQRASSRHVLLDVELGIVFDRLAGLGIEALGPVQIVDVLAALDEAAIAAIERVEKSIAAEVRDDLARFTVDRHVVEHVNADLVIVPRVVRQVLEIPGELAGIDVERDDGVSVEVVAGTRHRIVVGNRVAGAPDGELGGRVI